MNKRILVTFCMLIGFCLMAAPFAMAGVTPEEAATLKTTLTPFGAERAGNAAKTIPEWTPVTGPPGGGTHQPGARYIDLYKDDKPLYSIKAGDVEKYKDQLSDGIKALFKKYPDTFRIDVYPSHRPHAMPQWNYDNTMKNATRSELVEKDGKYWAKDCYGGVPFPIVKKPQEIMWNHLIRWMGASKTYEYNAYLVQPDGSVILSSGSTMQEQYPYYYPEGNLESFKGDYFYYVSMYQRPPKRKGEILLLIDPVNMIDSGRRAWQYLTGQRRVRMAPTVAFDTPNPAFSGTVTYDDPWVFCGSMERYDWKLVGKKEMLIPYNCYKMLEKGDPSKKFTKGHVNPDYLRWELHRVWVVAATLRAGKRHNYASRTFYADEDSWNLILADSYDGTGKLWRTNAGVTAHCYDLPGVVYFQNLHFDLPTGALAVNFDFSEFDNLYFFDKRKPEDYFMPDQIRRMGQ